MSAPLQAQPRALLLLLVLLLTGCGEPVPGTWYVSGKRFEPEHSVMTWSLAYKCPVVSTIPDQWFLSLTFRPSAVESEKGMPWWQNTRAERQVSESVYNSRTVGDVWKTGW